MGPSPLPGPAHSGVSPPLTLLVPCANGLFMPYIQQPGFLYGLPGANLPLGGPIPPNKLALAPLSPGQSSSLNSPMSSNSAVSSRAVSAVSTPTEELPAGRHLLLSHLNHDSTNQELLHLPRPEIIRKDPAGPAPEAPAQPPKVVLRKKAKTQNSEIQQSVENHFRRSLGSNYNEIKLHEQSRPKTNVRRRPHSVFVSEEVHYNISK